MLMSIKKNLTAVVIDFPLVNTSILLEQLLPASSNPLKCLPMGNIKQKIANSSVLQTLCHIMIVFN